MTNFVQLTYRHVFCLTDVSDLYCVFCPVQHHCMNTWHVEQVCNRNSTPIEIDQPLITAMGLSFTASLEMPASWHVFTTSVTSL